jgi:peptide/nickel transport system ATP-binding protein
MLDMSVRAKILELMLELKAELDLTYVYITHDLATAKFFCDRIAIMYLGRIVEQGPAEEIYSDPKHPYTQALLRAIPDPDPTHDVPRDLPRGEVPDAVQPPLGCNFHPRCPKAFEVCGWESRDLRAMLETRWTKLSEAEFEEERKLVGDLDALDEPSTDALLEPGPEAGPEDAGSMIGRLKAQDPDDPFWTGVEETSIEEDGAHVRFHNPVEPRTLDVGGATVECHLHDPEALAAAERLRKPS